MPGFFDDVGVPDFTLSPLPQRTSNRNLFSAGLSAGVDELQGLGGSAIQAVGKLTNLEGVEKYGQEMARRNARESAANGRPDLEVNPWDEGGPSYAPWLGYQAAKMAPTMAAYLAGSFVGPSAPLGLARAAQFVPRILGGGGAGMLDAGASIAARRAAVAGGRGLADDLVGGTLAGMPIATGSMYQQADQREQAGGEAASWGDAAKSIALSPVYSALDALGPSQLKGLLSRGQATEKGALAMAQRVATAGTIGGVMEMPQEAMQTALELSFRPDLSPNDKYKQIVDAALTGGAVGGIYGAAGGIRRARGMTPSEMTDAELKRVTDAAIHGELQGRQDELTGALQPMQEDPHTLAAMRMQEEIPGLNQAARDNVVAGDLQAEQDQLQVALLPQREDPNVAAALQMQQGSEQARQLSDQAVQEEAFRNSPEELQKAQTAAMRGVAKEWAGKAVPIPQSVPLNDEADIAAWALNKLDGKEPKGGHPAYLLNMAARLGLTDERGMARDLAAEIEAIDARKEALKPAMVEAYGRGDRAALTEIQQQDKALDRQRVQIQETQSLQDVARQRVAERSNVAATPVAPEVPGLPAPVASTGVAATPTALGEALAPLARQMQMDEARPPVPPTPRETEFALARQQADQQQQQQVEAAFPAAKAAVALAQPVTFDHSQWPTNSGGDQAKRRTAAWLSSLPEPNQTALLAAPEFTSDPNVDPMVALMRTVGSSNNQDATVRPKLAQLAGVDLKETIKDIKAPPGGKKQIVAAAPPVGQIETRLVGERTPQVGSVEKPVIVEPVTPHTRAQNYISPAVQARTAEIEAQEKVAEAKRVRDERVAQSRERKYLKKAGVTTETRRMDDPNLTKAKADRAALLPVIDKMFPRETYPEVNKKLRALATGGKSVVPRKAAGRAAISASKNPVANYVNRRMSVAEVKQAIERARVERDTPAPPAKVTATPTEKGFAARADRFEADIAKDEAALAKPVDKALKGEARKEAINERKRVKASLEGRKAELAEIRAAIAKGQHGLADALMGLRRANYSVAPGENPDARPYDRRFQNVRPASDSNVDWHKNVTRAINTLSKAFGFKAPKVWIADPTGQTDYDSKEVWGLAIKADHIILSSALNSRHGIGVAMHELGHIIEKAIFDKAPPAVRAAIHAAFRRETGKSGMKTVQQLRPVTSDMAGETERGLEEYEHSFREWFAEQVSRWLTTSAKPVSIVDKFFAGIAKYWQQIYDFVVGHTGLTPEVSEFMEGAWRGDYENGVQVAPTTPDVAQSRAAGSVTGSNSVMKDVMSTVRQLSERGAIETKKANFRKSMLGWSTVNHMVEHFGKAFKSIAKYRNAEQARTAVSAKLSHLFTTAYAGYERLTDQKQEALRKLMRTTEFRIDPTRGWDSHTHLHDEHNAEKLKKLLRGANSDYANIGPEGRKAYADVRAVNEALHYGMMATSIHNLMMGDQAVPNTTKDQIKDPMQGFMDNSSLHQSPTDARDYWQQATLKLKDQAQAHLDERYGEIEKLDKDKTLTAGTRKEKTESIRHGMAALEKRVESIDASIKAMNESPYFHLGRFGQYFVGFQVKHDGKAVDKDGKKLKGTADPAALEAIAKAIEAEGFDGVQISTESGQPRAYIRVDTEDQAQRLRDIVEDLKKKDLLNADSDIVSGKRSDETSTSIIAPEWLDQFVQRINSDPSFQPDDNAPQEVKDRMKKTRDYMSAQARDMWLDMLPDTALSKVTSHRNSVVGYNKDMMRNFAFRSQVGIHALSKLSSSAKLSDAFTSMRGEINESKAGRDVDKTVLQQDIMEELLQREAGKPERVGHSAWDTLKAMGHAYFLGMSPAYAGVNLTQIPILLWPELSKKHGFVNSAKAIAKVTPMAFNIMKATLAEGTKKGWRRAADATINTEALVRAGVPKETAEFIMRVVNTGNIDIGSAARELGRASDDKIDSKTDLALRYAGAMGYYTETMTRLIAALSARELHGNKPGLDEYANKTVSESMLTYAAWNTARQIGKSGIAGKYSPVMFSFMNYTMQLTEKMYREAYTAMKGSTPEEKAAARRFLGSHLMALTAFAGSLGLPFASVVARSIEKLKDLFDDDDEPFDAKAEWRNFLSDTFGKGVGEVLARGLPRAAGFDISGRVGEADILPFTKLLTDRRKWEDASKDFAMNKLGAPISMLSNIIAGGRDIMNGDVLSGMKQMAPLGIRNPIEAFRMSQDGYTDRAGNTLPMSPGATDILWQALGLAPANKAEYSEAKMAQTVRKGDLVREAGIIRRQLASAIEGGDRTEQLALMKRARQFDANNPAYAVLPRLGGTLQRRAKDRATAESGQNPLGTNRRDTGAQSLTNYANF